MSYPYAGNSRDNQQAIKTLADQLRTARQDIMNIKRAVKALENLSERTGNSVKDVKNLIVAIMRIIESIAPENQAVSDLTGIVTSAASFGILGTQLGGPIGGAVGIVVGTIYGALEAVFG